VALDLLRKLSKEPEQIRWKFKGHTLLSWGGNSGLDLLRDKMLYSKDNFTMVVLFENFVGTVGFLASRGADITSYM
jgi:hypothetical protein